MEDSAVNRLMTITGVNLAVRRRHRGGDRRHQPVQQPAEASELFGLNPPVRQSGLGAAHHGRISKIGRSHARAMLVDPGPRPRRAVHCMRFSWASVPGAIIRPPRWLWLASPLCSAGIY
jgi:hypothetical protein